VVSPCEIVLIKPVEELHKCYHHDDFILYSSHQNTETTRKSAMRDTAGVHEQQYRGLCLK